MDAARAAVLRRLALRSVLVLATLAGLLCLAAGLIPSGRGPMPETIWIREVRVVTEGEVRVGAVDGAAFEGAHWVSSWDSGWSPSGGEGISFSRTLTEGERRQYRLARLGVLPRFRVYGAGYEFTGHRVERDGAKWREFRLFDRRFNYWQVGWWPW